MTDDRAKCGYWMMLLHHAGYSGRTLSTDDPLLAASVEMFVQFHNAVGGPLYAQMIPAAVVIVVDWYARVRHLIRPEIAEKVVREQIRSRFDWGLVYGRSMLPIVVHGANPQFYRDTIAACLSDQWLQQDVLDDFMGTNLAEIRQTINGGLMQRLFTSEDVKIAYQARCMQLQTERDIYGIELVRYLFSGVTTTERALSILQAAQPLR